MLVLKKIAISLPQHNIFGYYVFVYTSNRHWHISSFKREGGKKTIDRKYKLLFAIKGLYHTDQYKRISDFGVINYI